MEQQTAAVEPVIDLAHLGRMTMGNAALEREVLSLFYAHSALLIERMHGSDPDAVPALAHTLKGSALGIGANEVARAADALQRVPADKAAMSRLDRALEEARAAIGVMLARPGD